MAREPFYLSHSGEVFFTVSMKLLLWEILALDGICPSETQNLNFSREMISVKHNYSTFVTGMPVFTGMLFLVLLCEVFLLHSIPPEAQEFPETFCSSHQNSFSVSLRIPKVYCWSSSL